MDIKQLKFLIALARERHFGRAADACFISQPTLSARIRQLETELGVLLVERAQHSYHGLTPEGKTVLLWAKHIVATCDALRQDVSAMRGNLSGTLALGVVPTALAYVPLLSEELHRRHPNVAIRVQSQSSAHIQRGLDQFEIECGITYIDNEPLQRVRSTPLYKEDYRLLVASDSATADQDRISWAQAGALPLCLLTPDMQFRRILNAAFAQAGVTPNTVLETNSVANLYAHSRLGGLATILPERFLTVMGLHSDVRSLPLVDPEVSFTIGLVAADRDPPSPLASAMFEVAEIVDQGPPEESDPNA